MKALAKHEEDVLRSSMEEIVPLEQIVPELARGEFIRHCADCTYAKVRASLESKSGIEIYCGEGKWRDKSSHRKTFKRMSVVLDVANGYFKEVAEVCPLFNSMAT
jgi:hypothetical protein